MGSLDRHVAEKAAVPMALGHNCLGHKAKDSDYDCVRVANVCHSMTSSFQEPAKEAKRDSSVFRGWLASPLS